MSGEFVPAAELGPAHEVCPVCGGSDFARSGRPLQDDPLVELLECHDCGVMFASRFPSEAYLTALYEPSEYEPDLNASPNASRRLGERIAATLIDLRSASGALHVVDYGGADGTLLHEVEKALPASIDRSASTFTVVDLFPQELEFDLGYATVDEFFAWEHQVDVILASAVVEHLPEIRSTLSSLDARLRPGGLFYARTPYEEPIASRVNAYPSRWPRHLFDMGPAFWGGFGDNVMPGYRLERSRTAPPDTDLSADPVRTGVATALKAVSTFETRVVQPRLGYNVARWPFVGSWEAWFTKTGSPAAS